MPDPDLLRRVAFSESSVLVRTAQLLQYQGGFLGMAGASQPSRHVLDDAVQAIDLPAQRDHLAELFHGLLSAPLSDEGEDRSQLFQPGLCLLAAGIVVGPPRAGHVEVPGDQLPP